MAKRKCSLKSCSVRLPAEQMIVRGVLAWCSEDHQVEWALQSGKKLRQKKEKGAFFDAEAAKKRKRESLPHQLELTRVVFNGFIRALDADIGCCISCGRSSCGGSFDAGHYKSVGSHPELRFDPRNCYKQGSGCNRAGSERRRNDQVVQREYEQRLRAKMGDALVDWLNGPHKPKHYTAEDLKALRKMYAAESRRLEKGLGPSRDWRAL